MTYIYISQLYMIDNICIDTIEYVYIYVCRTFWVHLGIVSSYDYIKYYIILYFAFSNFKIFNHLLKGKT